MCSNGAGQNREADTEHDEFFVKEEFQSARVKFERGCEGDREALNMGNCSINILVESELEIA